MLNTSVRSPLQATVVQWLVTPGARFVKGDVVVILEAMKMEHEVRAEADGRVTALNFNAGDLVNEGDLLMTAAAVASVSPAPRVDSAQNMSELAADQSGQAVAANSPRPDLQRVLDRHAFTLDAHRPDALAKRQAGGGRSARENIADLCDAQSGDGSDHPSFIEYGALAIAAQSRRRSLDDLVANTPADGMVTGIGNVNAQLFGAQ